MMDNPLLQNDDGGYCLRKTDDDTMNKKNQRSWTTSHSSRKKLKFLFRRGGQYLTFVAVVTVVSIISLITSSMLISMDDDNDGGRMIVNKNKTLKHHQALSQQIIQEYSTTASPRYYDGKHYYHYEPAVTGTALATSTNDVASLVRAWERSEITVNEAKERIWNIVNSQSYKDHRPNRGIVFVKTPKTGSSTVTSVMHSIATSHNLTTPVSMQMLYDIRTPNGKHTVNHLQTTTRGINHPPFDIWCNHVYFDDFLLRDVVPSSNGTYVSILRDPATRLQSHCKYFKCCPARTEKRWITYILSNPNAESVLKERCGLDVQFEFIAGNVTMEQQTKIKEKAQHGDLLLLVTERMAESMVVLRSYYNLHPLDVAFLSKKTSNKRPAAGVNHKISLKRRRRVDNIVRQWNSFDTDLHKLANSLLTKKLNELYPDETIKQRTIAEFELLNDLIYHVCDKVRYNVTSQLNNWCDEKHMDEYPWNRLHLNLLK